MALRGAPEPRPKPKSRKVEIMKFQLGVPAKDKVTGFKGMLTGYCKYLTGCDQYLITPECDDDNKPGKSGWYDENRIEFTSTDQPPLVLEDETDKEEPRKKGSMDPAPTY